MIGILGRADCRSFYAHMLHLFTYIQSIDTCQCLQRSHRSPGGRERCTTERRSRFEPANPYDRGLKDRRANHSATQPPQTYIVVENFYELGETETEFAANSERTTTHGTPGTSLQIAAADPDRHYKRSRSLFVFNIRRKSICIFSSDKCYLSPNRKLGKSSRIPREKSKNII